MTEIFELPDFPENKKDFLEKCGFSEQVNDINQKLCPMCRKKIFFKDFRDGLGIKEYTISGLCQECQDLAFEKEKERCRVFLAFKGCIEVLVPKNLPTETKKLLAQQKALAGLRINYNSARDSITYGEGNKNLEILTEQGDIPDDVAYDLWTESKVPDTEEFVCDVHSEGVAFLNKDGSVNERYY